MQPFVHALQADRAEGLHVPWPDLALKLWIPKGTLVILFGAPGSLKSMLSLVWAISLGAPARLVSLDTDPLTQGARIISNLSGVRTGDVLGSPEQWGEQLESYQLPILALDTPVSAVQVDEIIRADTEYWGKAPELVVVDDVSKLKMEERGYSGFDEAMLELHRSARRHKTVVLAIHHLHRGGEEQKVRRSRRPRMHDGKFTGEYEAPIVLGVWRPVEDRVRISVLKNRFGPDDPDGEMYTELMADPTKCQFRVPTQIESYQSMQIK